MERELRATSYRNFGLAILLAFVGAMLIPLRFCWVVAFSAIGISYAISLRDLIVSGDYDLFNGWKEGKFSLYIFIKTKNFVFAVFFAATAAVSVFRLVLNM